MAIFVSGFSTSDAEALGKGLLYGHDSAFSSGFRELVRSAGVSHLVAASGANLGYVLLLPQLTLGKVHWRLYQFTSLLLIWLYWQLAEQSGSLWRAIGMWAIGFLAVYFGRRPSSFWSLFLWALVCTFFYQDRLFSHSFALSSLAILGLLFSQNNKSGENNIDIFKHSKSRMQKWFSLMCQSWHEGSAIFLWVGFYLWFVFKTFQPTGIYTTLVLQPFLPVYLVLSGLLEVRRILEFFFPGLGNTTGILKFFSLVARWQNQLFGCVVMIMQLVVQISHLEVWQGLVTGLFLVYVCRAVLQNWRAWVRQQSYERWRSTIDFKN